MKIERKEHCCGCSACKTVCPKNAITMNPDKLGFLYPEIDESKCIECDCCTIVCDFVHRINYPLKQNDNALIFAIRHKNMDEVKTSQSGGASVALYNWVLNHGGVAYGCGYGKHFQVQHKRITTKEDVLTIKGSKYVQSDINSCFDDAIKDLKSGKYVLFTGTGCQIAGFLSLVRLMKIDETKLVTCDLICHGVPSPRLWGDYVNYIEKKLRKPLIKVDFRDKTHYGWADHKETFYTTYTTYTTYTYIFYGNVSLRPSCEVCPYTSTTRLADFTVCDFWGYEKIVPEMGKDNKGLSLMFVSTPKAQNIFEEIKSNYSFKKLKINDCLQPNMIHPTKFNIKYKEFEKDYETYGFNYIMKKYGGQNFTSKIKRVIKRIICFFITEKKFSSVKKLVKR